MEVGEGGRGKKKALAAVWEGRKLWAVTGGLGKESERWRDPCSSCRPQQQGQQP